MNEIIQFLSGDVMGRLIVTLLHSLWQGVLIAGVLYVVLRRLSVDRADGRYAAAGIALIVLVLSTMVTWAVLDLSREGSPAPAVRPAAPNGAALPAPASPSATEDAVPAGMSSPLMAELSWAAAAWLTGVTVMLVRMLTNVMGAGRLRMAARLTEEPKVVGLVEGLRVALGIRGRVLVRVSEAIAVPAVLGVLWPTILLPAAAVTGLSTDQLRAILAHELAHVRRYDYLVNLAQMVVEALFFFNPAVWWISRQIRVEREACCDRMAVGAIGEKVIYVQTLADWGRRLTHGPVPGPALADPDRPSGLLDRVRRLLVPGYRPVLRLSWHGLLITMLLAAVILAGLRTGTFAAVCAAARILTPHERIEKMEAIQWEYAAPELSVEEREKLAIRVSGTIRTSDNAPLPTDLQATILSIAGNSSSFISVDARNGRFTCPQVPPGRIYVQARGAGYACSAAGPLEGKPRETLDNVSVVLERGFLGRILIRRSDGSPVSGARLSGGFQIIPGSWTGGGHWLSDSEGQIEIRDTGRFPLGYTLVAHGFQKMSGDLTLKADTPSVLVLRPARPIQGIVVSEATGRPVAGATVQVVREGDRTYGPDDTSFCVTTDKAGRFVFDYLRDNTDYSFYIQVAGRGPARLDHIYTGQPGLRVSLGPELVARGKILAPPGKAGEYTGPRVLSYEKSFRATKTAGYSASNKELKVTVRDGVGYFETKDLWLGTLTILAGGKRFSFEIDRPRDDLVIDLREVPDRRPRRPLLVQFDLPADGPVPSGRLKVQWTADNGTNWSEKLIPIQRGPTRLEVPVPSQVWYEPVGLVGYWIERMYGIRVPEERAPFVITVPVSPGGAIYGRIVDWQGRPVGRASMSVLTVAQPPAIKQGWLAAEPRINGLDGRFIVSPLPLDGTFALIAGLEDSWVVSRPMKVDVAHPISQVELKLAEGRDITGQVLDLAGAPVAGVQVSLNAHIEFPEKKGWRHSSGGPRRPVDAGGHFRFAHVNPDIPGEYMLNATCRKDYQPMSMNVTPGGPPLTIRLRPGLVLTGVVVDNATGEPISGVEVRASAIDYDPLLPASSVEAEAPTDSRGRFRFSTMADRDYRFFVEGAAWSQHNYEFTARPGQKEPVVLRVAISPRR